MESVLNKLRDKVSSTVYQVTSNISTALPGLSVTREYELLSQVGAAGPLAMWKVFDALKKSTKEEASLFVLDKKCLERFSRREREAVLETMRKGVSQLTRLRHPSVLTVEHTLDESRDSLAFVTEPVIASLANMLGDRQNMAEQSNKRLENFEFFDVEIKYGLLRIAEGLAFLHNDVKLMHRNIAPQSIVVNKYGVWKIFGLEFVAQAVNPNESPLRFATLSAPNLIVPNIDYLAPEYGDQTVTHIDISADMFSLALLTYTLYNKGKSLLSSEESNNWSISVARNAKKLKHLSHSTMACIPQESRTYIQQLLSVERDARPDAQQFSKLHLFDDVLVKTLQYFDSLYEWDNSQKSHFYKGLPEILSRMPKRVKLERVICGLSKEFVNPSMVPFVLPNILLIARDTNDEEFSKWIIPDLINALKIKEPIQISIILMQNMNFLVDKFKPHPEAVREHILPLIYRSLECENQQLEELCLTVIPSLAHMIDYTAMKNALLPRINKLVLGSNILSVRVNCLICIGKILENLDKWLVIDYIFPVLPQIHSKEPAVIMASIDIYKLALNSAKLGLPKEVLATKVVPYLVPLSIENGLNLEQFQTIMCLIRDMLCKIEDEHRVKLQQLDSMKVEQQSLFNAIHTSSSNDELFSPVSSLFANNINKSSGTLTLQLDEKESLAKREINETQASQTAKLSQILQASQPLQASQASPSVKAFEISKPIDLTSSLINSNLSNLSFNTSSAKTIENEANVNNFSYASQPNSQFNGLNLSKYSMQTLPQSQTQVRPNLSPFDNIIIPDIKKSSPLTLQQIRTSTNTVNNNVNNDFGEFCWASDADQSKPSKQLSKKELEDFLK